MSEDQIEHLKECYKYKFTKMKIDGYMKQDEKANRNYDKKQYINHYWFLDMINKSFECTHCGEAFCKNENGLGWNISADRIDNSLAHLKSNCVLSCIECNRSRSNKNNIIEL